MLHSEQGEQAAYGSLMDLCDPADAGALLCARRCSALQPSVHLGSLFWEAREVFTWEEKVEKRNSIVSKRGQVGKGAKKIRHLEHLFIYSLLFFKETP